ncbi:MAG: YggS family pyridoxal phosphate-dependent enzyme [Bacteroides sp.]|jgi:pyridoxal phosphate enzyme (YggS family)|nr:YggS family pyridoxal phosphate-dependent enzyme [Bacteroides sp.]
MSAAEKYLEFKNNLPENVKLVAVSKTKPEEDILEVYNAGQRIFGENKVQEMLPKYEALPKDIEWHLIGHLQTNKAKYVAPFVGMIHSVDSIKLLKAINKEAKKNNRVIPCLLQFHIAEEETKFGLSLEEAEEILTSETFSELKNIKISGVMGMATFTDDQEKVQREFRHLKQIFEHLREAYFSDDSKFTEISMGMSDDYQIAIEEGSTMVRVGSSIFGSRNE